MFIGAFILWFLVCPTTTSNSFTSSYIIISGALPSLLESQARFDAAAAATATTGSDAPINELALSHVLKGNIRVANTLPDINSVITALRTHLASLPTENRVVGLDCEWRVTRNRKYSHIMFGRTYLKWIFASLCWPHERSAGVHVLAHVLILGR